jgi:hypothetical protein
MKVKVISGRKIPIGVIANVLKIYWFKIPTTQMKIKRAILEGYGSTDFKNLKVLEGDEYDCK